MKLKRENDLQKNCDTESSKTDDKKENERKKKSEQKKESEKKIKSGKSERKTNKRGSFYAKANDVKNVFLYKLVYICILVQIGMF